MLCFILTSELWMKDVNEKGSIGIGTVRFLNSGKDETMSELSLGNQRQLKIIGLMAENDAIQVTDLSSRLKATSVPIRRDLESLKEQKRRKKHHDSISLVKPKNPKVKFFSQ